MKPRLGPKMSRFRVPNLSDEQSLPGIGTRNANLFPGIYVAFNQILSAQIHRCFAPYRADVRKK